MWPGVPEDERPVGAVTNGVHGPTWTARDMTDLVGDRLDSVSDVDLWDLRCTLRRRLVAEVRRRVREAWLQRGASPLELAWTDTVFDPDVLTVGFVDVSAAQLAEGMSSGVAAAEAERHSKIDDVIESTELRAFYDLRAERDFTAAPRPIEPGSAESLLRTLTAG